MFGDFAMYLVKFSIITLQGQERRKENTGPLTVVDCDLFKNIFTYFYYTAQILSELWCV